MTYGLHPFGMIAPAAPVAAEDPAPDGPAQVRVLTQPETTTTETTVDVDGTLSIQRWTARLVLHFSIRRRR